MATLQDIADEVGVAISTVSRVLNGTPDARVTDEVRQRVLSTADALGYVPNLYARGLARGRGSHASVCVWSMMSHSSSLRNRAISRAAANVYAQTITTDVSPMSSPDELLQLLNSQLPQACILVSGSWRPDTMARVVQHLHGRGVHCVVVDSSWALDPSVPCDTVRADRTSGSKLAVSHLIEQGHRHIGIVSLLRITGRVAGYEEALDEQGITDRYIAPLGLRRLRTINLAFRLTSACAMHNMVSKRLRRRFIRRDLIRYRGVPYEGTHGHDARHCQ